MTDTAFVERVAEKIINLGLTAPAILVLEAHKPVAFLLGQLFLVAQPTLNIFFSPQLTNNLVAMFSESNQLEALIKRLEMAPATSQPADIEKGLFQMSSKKAAQVGGGLPPSPFSNSSETSPAGEKADQ